jgi:hypothetical protein
MGPAPFRTRDQPLKFGASTNDQVDPFHSSISARNVPISLGNLPTAKQVVELLQETPLRSTNPDTGPVTNGELIVDHVCPFQRSTIPSSELESP